ncbi:XRE family transcriptional regulator [Bacillus rubiinfantis]|uniref:XRE family transcriptional regulator n=1 Tax=Bacillus rubiinfantis TaxID=1499680 RepID=UPI0005A977B8|nr:XRE family transcriptional regulator [Bacillus rubiinfantis]
MIGKRIRQVRQQKGYSISELAKMADVSKSYLSKIERGEQANPSLLFLQKVAATLETNVDNFLEERSGNTKIDYQLDEEWRTLIQSAIDNGLKAEDLRAYLAYRKYQDWKIEQEKDDSDKKNPYSL